LKLFDFAPFGEAHWGVVSDREREVTGSPMRDVT